MKILEINKFHYRRGGADHHFLDLCALLQKKGEKVSVFSMKDARNEPSPYEKYFVSNAEFGKFNLRSFLRPFRIIYSFEAAKKLQRLIGEERPDIAHLHLIYHHLSPSVLAVLKKNNIPVVMTIHDWKPLCPNYLMYTEGNVCERCRGGRYYQCAKHLCMRRSFFGSAFASLEAYIHHAKKYYEKYVDLYIAPSRFVKDIFVKWGMPENKIAVLQHFLPPSIERQTMATPAPKDPSFAFIGRLSEEKGAFDLVVSWIKRKIPFSLHIFGDGRQKQKIEKFIRRSGAQNIFLHGQMGREEIAKHIRQMTAVVIPSKWYEIFGLVALEAWSQGVPIVAAPFGSLPELVNQSAAGVISDVTNDDLPTALNRVAGLEMRQNAVDYLNVAHLPDNYYTELMKIFSKTIITARK